MTPKPKTPRGTKAASVSKASVYEVRFKIRTTETAQRVRTEAGYAARNMFRWIGSSNAKLVAKPVVENVGKR